MHTIQVYIHLMVTQIFCMLLSMAGGVDENGSYRKIDLIRNNEVIKSVDLYDIFIYGRSGFGERLRSGDSILVRPSMKMVTISGAVKRPALYELN